MKPKRRTIVVSVPDAIGVLMEQKFRAGGFVAWRDVLMAGLGLPRSFGRGRESAWALLELARQAGIVNLSSSDYDEQTAGDEPPGEFDL